MNDANDLCYSLVHGVTFYMYYCRSNTTLVQRRSLHIPVHDVAMRVCVRLFVTIRESPLFRSDIPSTPVYSLVSIGSIGRAQAMRAIRYAKIKRGRGTTDTGTCHEHIHTSMLTRVAR